MTVPTNNEEAEALGKIIKSVNIVREKGDTRNYTRRIADAILAAGFRRLPVSGDTAEQEALAAWQADKPTLRVYSEFSTSYLDGYRDGAASQPREVEVTDDTEWGVYSEREGNFYHVQPPTYENAAREAALVGEAHRPVPKALGAELSNAWNHGRHAALGGGDHAE